MKQREREWNEQAVSVKIIKKDNNDANVDDDDDDVEEAVAH